MLQYKIKSVRFYQAVVVCGITETFIINPEYQSTRRDSQASLKLSTNDKGLVVESSNELTQISWNNIAAIYYDKNAPLESNTKTASKQSKKDESVDFRNI